jgi:hypothetical protein
VYLEIAEEERRSRRKKEDEEEETVVRFPRLGSSLWHSLV